jgi:hypothetical protein
MGEVRFLGTVGHDQVIRLPAGISLPEGEVEVTVRVAEDHPASGSDAMATTRAWLLAMADEAEALAPDLPADLAEHHDHYAHGKPRP